jgi:hypothetical protein
MVQDPEARKGYSESWMQETHPLTWAYLKKFEKLLRERKAFKKFFDSEKDPFYSMYSVAAYTFSPYKVSWMDISATVKAAAIVSGTGNDLPIPEHKLHFLTAGSADEAYYVAAVMNSVPVNTVISGYIVDNCVGTHPIDNVAIPAFDSRNDVHRQLVKASRQAHQAAASGNSEMLIQAEKSINQTVQGLW